MIYEMRTYRLRTGTLPAYLKLVGEEGIAIQKSHLGTLVGYFFSDIGPLNQIVHIWAFAGLDDRETRRTALAADPRWAPPRQSAPAWTDDKSNLWRALHLLGR